MFSSKFTKVMKILLGLIAMNALSSQAFVPHGHRLHPTILPRSTSYTENTPLTLHIFGSKNKKATNNQDDLKQQVLDRQISSQRRKQLGIPDGEREYDLDVALEQNTDPLITKLIAGSFILVVIGLLVAGIVIPSLTDYGEGVCNPLLTAGRC